MSYKTINIIHCLCIATNGFFARVAFDSFASNIKHTDSAYIQLGMTLFHVALIVWSLSRVVKYTR